MTKPAALFDRLAELAGPRPLADAHKLVATVIFALSRHVPRQEWRRLAHALPPELQSVPAHEPDPTAGLSQLVAEVADGVGLAQGDALEQLEAVCRVLSERLGPEQRALLLRRVPDALVPLFELPAATHPPTAPRPSHSPSSSPSDTGQRHTLAGGRPGSGHPISESAPDRAQSGSVARWDGHRADHTLGSYSGDDGGATLADGRPAGEHEDD